MPRIKRRDFITRLGGAAATWPIAARGQQNRRPWRIAFPEEGAGFAGATKRFDAFRNGLRELGYTDDNSIIDRRVGNGRKELVALCQNMITHGADVIVAGSSNLALAAQEVTKTVPIVIRAAADPVAAGLVASLAHPGGNITGFTFIEFTMVGKWLEMLKAVSPGMVRAALMFNPNTSPYYDVYLRSFEALPRSIAVEVTATPVRNTAEIEEALLGRQPGGGLIDPPAVLYLIHRALI